MYKYSKRFIDITIAALVLIVCLPLLLPIVLLLKITGEGHIFYFQKRVGYKNTYFSIWKFATMLKDSPNMKSGTITLKNDTRVTPVGRFLRKTKLNEVPQIINVLKGDMSLVGPRPVDEKAFNMYAQDIKDTIYNVMPGITGVGSIVFRDEESIISSAQTAPHVFMEDVIAPHKGELELWYQQHASIRTDILLILLTAWVIFFPKSKLHYKIFKTLPRRI